jgi:hypothetical protein
MYINVMCKTHVSREQSCGFWCQILRRPDIEMPTNHSVSAPRRYEISLGLSLASSARTERVSMLRCEPQKRLHQHNGLTSYWLALLRKQNAASEVEIGEVEESRHPRPVGGVSTEMGI